MPVVGLLDELEAQEDEDDAVADRGHGLDGVLHGGVALLAQVLEAVPLDRDPEGDDADDARPVEELGHEEGEVGGGHDDEGLHDAHVPREARHDAGVQTVHQPDTRATCTADSVLYHPPIRALAILLLHIQFFPQKSAFFHFI